MPMVPNITGLTVAQARALPPFVAGLLRLETQPAGASPNEDIGNQTPPAGTMLDLGGIVTAIV